MVYLIELPIDSMEMAEDTPFLAHYFPNIFVKALVPLNPRRWPAFAANIKTPTKEAEKEPETESEKHYYFYPSWSTDQVLLQKVSEKYDTKEKKWKVTDVEPEDYMNSPVVQDSIKKYDILNQINKVKKIFK